jgi:hypothetical protein
MLAFLCEFCQRKIVHLCRWINKNTFHLGDVFNMFTWLKNLYQKLFGPSNSEPINYIDDPVIYKDYAPESADPVTVIEPVAPIEPIVAVEPVTVVEPVTPIEPIAAEPTKPAKVKKAKKVAAKAASTVSNVTDVTKKPRRKKTKPTEN